MIFFIKNSLASKERKDESFVPTLALSRSGAVYFRYEVLSAHCGELPSIV